MRNTSNRSVLRQQPSTDQRNTAFQAFSARSQFAMRLQVKTKKRCLSTRFARRFLKGAHAPRRNVRSRGSRRCIVSALSRLGHLFLIWNQSSGLGRRGRGQQRCTGNRINSRRDGKSNFRDCIYNARGGNTRDTDTPAFRCGLLRSTPLRDACRGVNCARLSVELTNLRPIKRAANLTFRQLLVNQSIARQSTLFLRASYVQRLRADR